MASSAASALLSEFGSSAELIEAKPRRGRLTLCGCGRIKPKSTLPQKLQADERRELALSTNLSEQEVDALYARFRRVAAPNTTMSREQFRGTLGILGMAQSNYLADALYRVFTDGNRGELTYDQFIQHLAIMLRGTADTVGPSDEKLILSFSLSLGSAGIDADGNSHPSVLSDLMAGGDSSGTDEEMTCLKTTAGAIGCDEKVEPLGAMTPERSPQQVIVGGSELAVGGAAGDVSGINSPERDDQSAHSPASTAMVVDQRSGKLVVASSARRMGGAASRLQRQINRGSGKGKNAGIRLEQFRELIRAIDQTTNSLLPAAFQKSISEETIEMLFYRIAANDYSGAAGGGKAAKTSRYRSSSSSNGGGSGRDHVHAATTAEGDVVAPQQLQAAQHAAVGFSASSRQLSPQQRQLANDHGSGQPGAASPHEVQISLDAYKNAVRHCPEFLELIGLLPPKNQHSVPPKTFVYNDRVWRIEHPDRFWRQLLELKSEVDNMKNFKWRRPGRSAGAGSGSDSDGGEHEPAPAAAGAGRGAGGLVPGRTQPAVGLLDGVPRLGEQQNYAQQVLQLPDPVPPTSAGTHSAVVPASSASSNKSLVVGDRPNYTVGGSSASNSRPSSSTLNQIKPPDLRIPDPRKQPPETSFFYRLFARGPAKQLSGDTSQTPEVGIGTADEVAGDAFYSPVVSGPPSASDDATPDEHEEIGATNGRVSGGLALVQVNAATASTLLAAPYRAPLPPWSGGGPSSSLHILASTFSTIHRQLESLFDMVLCVDTISSAASAAGARPGPLHDPAPSGSSILDLRYQQTDGLYLLPRLVPAHDGGTAAAASDQHSPTSGSPLGALSPASARIAPASCSGAARGIQMQQSGSSPGGRGAAAMSPSARGEARHLLLESSSNAASTQSGTLHPGTSALTQKSVPPTSTQPAARTVDLDPQTNSTAALRAGSSSPGGSLTGSSMYFTAAQLRENINGGRPAPGASAAAHPHPNQHRRSRNSSYNNFASRSQAHARKTVHKILGPKKGLAVHFGHENWNMVLHMMIGIRMAVGRSSNEMERGLQSLDFQMQDKFAILPNMANIMDSVAGANQNYTIFVDYAPFVFRKIRQLRGIKPEQYLRSVGPEQLLGNMILGNLSSLSELSSSGKSGAFFYYTADGKFMIKTVTKDEKELLQQMLLQYWLHIKKYPDSLLIKFFGLHALRVRKTTDRAHRVKERKIYFVVMGNMFNTPFEIHKRYDLKGSTTGRSATMKAGAVLDKSIARKDMDFRTELSAAREESAANNPPEQAAPTFTAAANGNPAVALSREAYAVITDQLKADSDFLARCNVIDYSLLLGVHYVQEEDKADFWRAISDLSKCQRTSTGGAAVTLTSSSAAARGHQPSSHGLQLDVEPSSPGGDANMHNALALHSSPSPSPTALTGGRKLVLHDHTNATSTTGSSKTRVAYHEQHFGGIAAADREQPRLYFIGVIDILTAYGFRKSVEHNVKSCLHPTSWRGVSCCPPAMYAERFMRFMRESVFREVVAPNRHVVEQVAPPQMQVSSGGQAAIEDVDR